VRTKSASQVITFLALAVMIMDTASAWPHHRGEKARVHFLATSTLIRGSWGQNQDTYLAQLYLPKRKDALLMRLKDTYPNEWAPLAREVLKSDTSTALFVQRDAECDRPFGEIVLRTAPGDPMALLPERLGYQPMLERIPTPGTILPCYQVVRR